MIDYVIIKYLLNNEFYNDNKVNLIGSLFDDEIRELYDIIVDAHDKYEKDLSLKEVFELWKKENPVATNANIVSMETIISSIENTELLNEQIASDIIHGLWQRETGRKIANLGIAMSEGDSEAYQRLLTLIDKSQDGFLLDDFGEPVTDDLYELLETLDDSNRYTFNINSLNNKVPGLNRSEFAIFFARPETGKTAFVISLSCAPNGFCDQGAKVLYLANEEIPDRTKLRAYSTVTGYSKDEIKANPAKMREKYLAKDNRIIMNDTQDWEITKMEAYIHKLKPDIVILDQGDKVKMRGSYDAPHLKLRELYTNLREVAKRQNIALISLCQASADADGKTVITPDQMEGSKTGKFAEADLIIGIGKRDDSADGTPEVLRFLNVCKNKINGFHGVVLCKLDGPTSRYVD